MAGQNCQDGFGRRRAKQGAQLTSSCRWLGRTPHLRCYFPPHGRSAHDDRRTLAFDHHRRELRGQYRHVQKQQSGLAVARPPPPSGNRGGSSLLSDCPLGSGEVDSVDTWSSPAKRHPALKERKVAPRPAQEHGFSGCTPYGATYLCWGFCISLARICRHGVGTLLAQTGEIAVTRNRAGLREF